MTTGTSAAIVRAIAAAPDRKVPSLRVVRREFTRRLKTVPSEEVLVLAEQLLSHAHVPRWLTYELVHFHRPTLRTLTGAHLGRLGEGLSAWDETDPFACYLSGVAWRRGQVADDVVLDWARSANRWWRRVSLVSTVALNSRARGGEGDPVRTLRICGELAADRDDMVVKAMSWAVREVIHWDEMAVRKFLSERHDVLSARVVREVSNKLKTGLKNP